MPAEKRLQQEVEAVHVAQRVLAVGKAPQHPRVVGLADEPEPADQRVVSALLVVDERRLCLVAFDFQKPLLDHRGYTGGANDVRGPLYEGSRQT